MKRYIERLFFEKDFMLEDFENKTNVDEEMPDIRALPLEDREELNCGFAPVSFKQVEEFKNALERIKFLCGLETQKQSLIHIFKELDYCIDRSNNYEVKYALRDIKKSLCDIFNIQFEKVEKDKTLENTIKQLKDFSLQLKDDKELKELVDKTVQDLVNHAQKEI